MKRKIMWFTKKYPEIAVIGSIYLLIMLIVLFLYRGRIVDKIRYDIDFKTSKYNTEHEGSEWNPLGFLTELFLYVEGYSLEEGVEIKAYFNKKLKFSGSYFIGKMFEYKNDNSFINTLLEDVYKDDFQNVDLSVTYFRYGHNYEGITKEQKETAENIILYGTIEDIYKYNEREFTFINLYINFNIYYEDEDMFEANMEKERQRIVDFVEVLEDSGIDVEAIDIFYTNEDTSIELYVYDRIEYTNWSSSSEMGKPTFSSER